MHKLTSNRMAWGLSALLAGVALGTIALCIWYLSGVFRMFEMDEEVAQQIRSPDGQYKAVLSYRDGLTYGYYHVLLERTTPHARRGPDEVTEVASEGLDAIAWRGARTLVVHYSCPENEFVVRSRQWQGIRITYQRQ